MLAVLPLQPARAGTLTINGGWLTAAGTLKVWNSSSQINLSGGTLSAGSLDTGGVLSRFYNNWSSGVLNITGPSGLAIDSTSSASLGNAPSISANHTLNVTNTLSIASGASLSIANGTLSTGSVALVLAAL